MVEDDKRIMKIVTLPIFTDRPSNPAKVNMATGTIMLNQQAMSLLPSHAQKFVLLHEVGHYRLQTYDEILADEYALSHLALRQPNSLWNYVQAVRMVTQDKTRQRQAAIKALEIAAQQGSNLAQELIKYYV